MDAAPGQQDLDLWAALSEIEVQTDSGPMPVKQWLNGLAARRAIDA